MGAAPAPRHEREGVSMEIITKRKYEWWEVVFKDGNASITTDWLNNEASKDLARQMREAADDIDPATPGEE